MIATVPGARQRDTFSIGLMIALSSWALIFFTLAWGYVVYRLRAASWLEGYLTPEAEALAALNTLVMGCSSLFLSRGLKDQYSKRWVWLASAFGILFLLGQMYLWQLILSLGLHWQSSIAGSFFFLLTGFHAVHIIGGVIALFILCLRMEQWRGSLVAKGIKYFWDFLFVVWLVLFGLVFIVQ